MIGYRYNDGGRAAAGFSGTAGDCVTRALAILTDADYQMVYDVMSHGNAAAGRKESGNYGVPDKVWRPVFEKLQLAKVVRRAGVYPTYSEAYERWGNCIVATNKHLCCLKDGALQDIFDGRIYPWEDEYGFVELRERKAMLVWLMRRDPAEVRENLARIRNSRNPAALNKPGQPRRRVTKARRPSPPVFTNRPKGKR